MLKIILSPKKYIWSTAIATILFLSPRKVHFKYRKVQSSTIIVNENSVSSGKVLLKYSVRSLTWKSTFEVHLKYTVFPLWINKVHFKYTLIVLQLYFLWESTLKAHFKYISGTTDLYLFFTRDNFVASLSHLEALCLNVTLNTLIAYSKITKRNLVMFNNDTDQRETSERPIRQPLNLTKQHALKGYPLD